MILDLRSNPGGLLDQAVKLSDLFLEKGDIVSTQGRYEEVERARYSVERLFLSSCSFNQLRYCLGERNSRRLTQR